MFYAVCVDVFWWILTGTEWGWTHKLRVRSLLSAMEIEIHDAELVFDLTDDGDDKMSPNEMIFGFSRLQGFARSGDVGAILRHQQTWICR